MVGLNIVLFSFFLIRKLHELTYADFNEPTSLTELFGEYKERIINEMTEEKSTCLKRVICEWTTRENLDLQENILKW